MNRETYDALVASVEKWREKALSPYHSTVEYGPSGCPLCKLFFFADCNGCPVQQATRCIACGDTPYSTACEALFAWKDGGPREAWQAAAQREADFLAALVPAGGPDE